MTSRFAILAVAVLIGFSTVGCHEGRKTEEGALIGAGAGALGGGIAAAAGASPWWILGGAAIGAAGGAIIGHSMDHADQEKAWNDHYSHCRAQHYQCVGCGAVFCNANACPNCHATEFRMYSR